MPEYVQRFGVNQVRYTGFQNWESLQIFQTCLLLQLKSQEIPSTSAFKITEQFKYNDH